MTVILLVVGAFLFLLAWHRNQYWRKRNVNGPKLRPFVGAMFSLINPRDPPAFVINRWTKEFGGFFGYQHGYKNVLVISDQKILHEILVEKFDCFMDRRMSPNINYDVSTISSNSLFSAGKHHWKHLRSLTNPIFSSSNLKQIFPIIDDSAKETVKLLNEAIEKNENDPINILDFTREYSMDIIARLAFDQKSTQQFKSNLVPTVVEVFNGFGSSIFCHLSWICPAFAAVFGKIGMLFEFLGSFAFVRLLISVQQKVEKRKKELQQNNKQISKQQDFINFFLHAESSENSTNDSYDMLSKKHMTLDEVTAQCTVFLMAGFETTANTLALIFHYLALYEKEQENLRQEVQDVFQDSPPTYDQLNKLKKLHAFINETLRLHPIANFAVSRVCTKETTLNSLKIEPGTHVQIDTLSLHTNPKIWGPDAEEFRPERWLDKNNTQIPAIQNLGFGLGRRQCIGKELALIELKVLLVLLLQQFQVLPTKTIEPLKFRGLTTLCPTNIKIHLKKLSIN